MLSGLADDEAADVPNADADDAEVADDAGVAAPVLLLPLLQPAATRARTLSPAAAITRFMVEIPPLLGEKCKASRGPAGDPPGCDRVRARSSHHGETGAGNRADPSAP